MFPVNREYWVYPKYIFFKFNRCHGSIMFEQYFTFFLCRHGILYYTYFKDHQIGHNPALNLCGNIFEGVDFTIFFFSSLYIFLLIYVNL